MGGGIVMLVVSEIMWGVFFCLLLAVATVS